MFDLREHKDLIHSLVAEANKNDPNWEWTVRRINKNEARIFWSYLEYCDEAELSFAVKLGDENGRCWVEARDQGGKIAWLVMAATCRTTFKFGKDRLTRLLNESLANYRQFLEWDAEDHEYAVNKLCRIVEQALQEELKVADESKRTEFLSVSGITPHDYGEIMTAVHLARKDRSVPIAVLSQSEIDRRMGKLKRA